MSLAQWCRGSTPIDPGVYVLQSYALRRILLSQSQPQHLQWGRANGKSVDGLMSYRTAAMYASKVLRVLRGARLHEIQTLLGVGTGRFFCR